MSADARRPPTTVDKVHALERITTRYGGVDFEPRYRLAIAMHGVLLGLATPWEIPRFIEGLHVTQSAMHAELLGLDMRNKVPQRSARRRGLGSRLLRNAPRSKKVLQWFERSAHNVPFDEPRLFNESVVQAIRSIEEGRLIDDPSVRDGGQ